MAQIVSKAGPLTLRAQAAALRPDTEHGVDELVAALRVWRQGWNDFGEALGAR